MNSLAARRRSPAAVVILLLVGLLLTGGLYAAFAPSPAEASSSAGSAEDIAAGEKLFLANCASCHGTNGQGNGDAGPSLVGVGAAAVDFQVGTGRMPLSGPNVQAPRPADEVMFSDEQISQMAAYVASLGPGPAIPDEEYTTGEGGDIARGGELFRVNCAMCHNSSGAGGALTRGKYAPDLMDVEGKYTYEAMLTGPQSMPVFNNDNLSPEDKNDIIAFIDNIDEGGNAYGGHSLGSLGPAGDAFFVWTIGIALLIGAAVWLGRKAA